MVVEGVSGELAEEITRTISIPTIGIGASAGCDGQILVTEDMIVMSDWTPIPRPPKCTALRRRQRRSGHERKYSSA